MNRRIPISSRFPSFIALATGLIMTLTTAMPADACLLAKRLRVVAPHLTEAEIELYAHGNMTPLKVHYELAAATPCVGGQADIYSCDGVDLLGHLNLSEIGGGDGNDLWGWTDPVTQAEIAIIGRTNGTAFIDVSDPENPVFLGNLPSHSGSSSWRDIKTFADHAFIVADGQPHGIQVFDLTQLRGVSSPPQTFSATAHYSGIANAHNIVINEATGFAYAVGSNTCSGGLHMVDINTPTTPTFAGCFSSDGYTHDAQCVNYSGPDSEHVGKEICFASNEDTLTIVDVSNKSNPIQLSRAGYGQTFDSHYAHQGWLTEDQQYFVLDDEFDELGQGHNTRTYVWDVSDLDSPNLNGFTDATGSSVDHNQYIRGNHTYQANYARGLRILELTDLPNADLTEVGFFDTYPESDGNAFDGAWSTYPFFASGIVLVSDINRGLFILRPQTTNSAPTVTITSPADGSSVSEGTAISFTGSANDTEDGDLTSSLDWTSDLDGNIGSGGSFSAPLSQGSHTVTASVTDSGSQSGSAQISVTVTACALPLGHHNYCRDCGPCDAGQGDCDGDAQCNDGLVCVNDVGANYGYSAVTDVCEVPSGCALPPGHHNYCRDCGPCDAGQGDCDGDTQCNAGLVCVNDVGANYGYSSVTDVCEAPSGCPWPVGHHHYCRDCGPCDAGQGDCDGDAQCSAGLTCVNDVGANYGYSSVTDVCEVPSGCPWPVGHHHYCRDCGPCDAGQGDCDGDAQCSAGLTCVNDVGANYGYSSVTDVCEAP